MLPPPSLEALEKLGFREEAAKQIFDTIKKDSRVPREMKVFLASANSLLAQNETGEEFRDLREAVVDFVNEDIENIADYRKTLLTVASMLAILNTRAKKQEKLNINGGIAAISPT